MIIVNGFQSLTLTIITKCFILDVAAVLDPPLKELLIHDQGISVHREDINTLSTEICKTFSGEHSYFMKSIFTKKDVIYNLRTSNLLTLSKVNTKRSGLYSFSFRATHLRNQLPDHIK